MEEKNKIFIHRGLLGLPVATEIDVTGEDAEFIRKDLILDWMDKEYDAAYGSALVELVGARMVLKKLKAYINSL